jgi:hypothetical protein
VVGTSLEGGGGETTSDGGAPAATSALRATANQLPATAMITAAASTAGQILGPEA